MKICGVERTSFCDWPGKVSTVLFTGGCNLRCDWCHNPGIAWNHESYSSMGRADICEVINSRRRWVDGIVVTGGEPTIQPDLPLFLRELKDSFPELKLKLDSNGFNPRMLRKVFEEVDVFAIDIKAPWRKYKDSTGVIDAHRAKETFRDIFLMARQAPEKFYFRTTQHPLLTNSDIEEIETYLPEGFVLKVQEFVNPGGLPECQN